MNQISTKNKYIGKSLNHGYKKQADSIENQESQILILQED